MAGLAVQFRITSAAAGAAGVLWLLLYRRWGDLLRFAATAALFSAGLYVAIGRLEPEMFRHILVLRKVIPHPAGVVFFVREVLSEPVFLLALSALLVMLARIVTRRWHRWQLLTIFLVISAAIGMATSLQAGANINYFYELLFASTPFAVLGLLRLRSGRLKSASVFVSLLLLFTSVAPQLSSAVRGALHARRQVAQRNRNYDDLRKALEGSTVLSSLPDVTILAPERVITEPILLNILVLTAGADLSTLEERIRKGDFDVVVTHPADYSWRSVPVLARGLRSAIMDAYQPHCMLGNMLFHLPKNLDPQHAEDGLGRRLEGIGCETCRPGTNCPGLGVQIESFQSTF